MVIGLIKNETEYKEALSRLDELLTNADSPELEREIELLGHLIDKYESEKYPIEYPDPISAIKNRMEDLGLKQKDLVKIIGSQSKISEVMNNKRPLSLPMMRALYKYLNIPAEVLIKENPNCLHEEIADIDYQKFPLREIAQRGWVTSVKKGFKDHAEEIVRCIYNLTGNQWSLNEQAAMLRQGSFRRRKADPYALQAWLLAIMAKANHFHQYCTQDLGQYKPELLNHDVLNKLARLSIAKEKAPALAMNYLAQFGIKLVFEKHFERTYLDGACLMLEDGTPVIGLTIRHDRIDAFWFTLFHEIAHLVLHISDQKKVIFDEDIQEVVESNEIEASEFAAQNLIPVKVWSKHPARITADKKDVIKLAEKIELHPAIIAGRLRYERNNFKILRNIAGNKLIRPFCEQKGFFLPVRK